jgi:hypothetical protein
MALASEICRLPPHNKWIHPTGRPHGLTCSIAVSGNITTASRSSLCVEFHIYPWEKSATAKHASTKSRNRKTPITTRMVVSPRPSGSFDGILGFPVSPSGVSITARKVSGQHLSYRPESALQGDLVARLENGCDAKDNLLKDARPPVSPQKSGALPG